MDFLQHYHIWRQKHLLTLKHHFQPQPAFQEYPVHVGCGPAYYYYMRLKAEEWKGTKLSFF